jgi:hypothetical protein
MKNIIRICALLLLSALIAYKVRAQGNNVFSGSEVNTFSPASLSTPGGQTWTTVRSATPGYFSAGIGGSYTGASDGTAALIDGYVKKYGNEAFTFPVGAGTDLRTLSISAPSAGTDAYATAWIPGHPKTTPDPTNAGAFHDTAAVTGVIKRVMNVGQWDWQALSGTGAGLTLTASMPDLTTFAPKGHLRLVGWNNATSKWVALGTTAPTSNAENTAITGTMTTGIDAIGIGSIAAGFPNLTPTIDIDDANFNIGQTMDFVVNVFEIANNITDGSTISFAITKPLSWTITVPGITLSGTNQVGVSGTSNVGGGTPNQNGSCLFRETGGFVIVTFQAAQVITGGSSAIVGFRVSRNAGVLSGVSQTLTTSLVNNSGGDITVSNNKTNIAITAN